MSTQAYYKDRLGFDPSEAMNDGQNHFGANQHGYEENLCKFKDERDAIQKKTFTKWVNKHLKKANRHVNDLFEDLRDGHNLISLLEVLSGEHLPRERGRLRFHMLQNVQVVLDFLRYRKIKLVNIRAEDIVDGNPKLILGLIWTIILHFQISDIVVGQEPNVTAKDVLLRWARRTTARYPGVRVTDFTGSWRDGLAFNAIIHRNRPDLIDWRNIRNRNVRERLDQAFHVVEREYGVTRLLDPEDVDTPQPDEKSLITYISSLYDVFPEPPPIHPLYDPDLQRRSEEYREIASQLMLWMREKLAVMQDRNFPATLIEMKKLANESSRFRNEEVPVKQHDKNRLNHLYRDLEKYFEAIGEIDIETEIRLENIEKHWTRLITAHNERDQAIVEEIKRLERLQRLAEKVHREMKGVEGRLEELEKRVDDEARRLDRLHPLDAKHNVDVLEHELRLVEDSIQALFSDVQLLMDGRYPQAPELHKRVQKLHQRWVALRSMLHTRLIAMLATMTFPVEERTVTRQTRTVTETRMVDTNVHFRQLQECTDWVRNKMNHINETGFGNELAETNQELEAHTREHKLVEQFQTQVEQCITAKSQFSGEELTLYTQQLTVLQKSYVELRQVSTKRLADLETLQDFLQSATNELMWLSEKEDVEVKRDWSDKSLDLSAVENYYESLMSDLEKREIQFSAVQDRGEALVLQHHPAAKCIEAYMAAMQSQWAWLLQLTLCLETHLRHAAHHHAFFKEARECEQWIQQRDEVLNSMYSVSEFSLDEGERLLKGMQELREELAHYGDVVHALTERSKEVVPLKQRRQPVTRPIKVTSVCSYKQNNISIEKGEQCILHDNSQRIKWKVTSTHNVDAVVPGVCFLLPPPDKDATDLAERLQRQFDRSVALWQKKQLRMRQNMIFATIKVVKSWDLAQFLAMGQEQRNAIRKALNEDADKLLQEGDPNDPQLRRLRREMDEVNRLFDEFERRARLEDETKQASRLFNEQAAALTAALDEVEHILALRAVASLPRDLDSLEHLVIEHKELETRLQGLEPDVEALQSTFRSVPRKTPNMQTKMDNIIAKWTSLWSSSHLYIERLKCVEIVLTGLEEATTLVSEFELKLASYETMPNEMEALQTVHEELVQLQVQIQQQSTVVDQLSEDVGNARRLVERSRPSTQRAHPDVDRLEQEVQRVTGRWSGICNQVSERLRSCEAGYELLQKYASTYTAEVTWMDDSYSKLKNLAPIEGTAREQLEPTLTLYNNVSEHVHSVEQVNVVGARFIREAKIYSSRLQQFRRLVEELQPSFDGSLRQAKRSRSSAASGDEVVSQQLDTLNHRFQSLLDILADRLRQIAALNPADPQVLIIVSQMEPRVFRTFRTELNIVDGSDMPGRYTVNSQNLSGDTPDHVSTVVVTPHEGSPIKHSSVHHVTSPAYRNGDATNGVIDPNGTSLVFTETRSVRRIYKSQTGPGGQEISFSDTMGIIDPRTGEVLSVAEAISKRILDVRSGKLCDPRTGRRMSINEGVSAGLIEESLAQRLLGQCGVIVDGRPLTLLEAIQKELTEAEKGGHFIEPNSGRPVSLEEAYNLGLIRKEQEAMEEKYRLCDETLKKLLEWIGDVEDQLANQDLLKEHIEDLKNQINDVKRIKDNLEDNSRPVATCLDQSRQVITQGAELLSSDEIAQLERTSNKVKSRYERACDRSDKLLRRLLAAQDELSKFRNELGTFNTWLGKSLKSLEERERSVGSLQRSDSTKEFVSDVIAHQADLRFITMAAQKFIDESKEYLIVLNDYRTSLPQRLSHLEPRKVSVVRQEVQEATSTYQELLAGANRLSDRVAGVGGRQREYYDSLDKAKAWLREAEPRANKCLSEPLSAEPRAVEEQLVRAKALHAEFLAQERLINTAVQNAKSLLKSLEGELSPQEAQALQSPVQELEGKYRQLLGALGERCQALDAALVQSQGVQDALDGLGNWLNSSESQLKTLMRPASLIKERLMEQIREHRLLQADVDSHRIGVEKVAQAAQELLATASNPRVAKKVETKLKEVTSRYEKTAEKVAKRGEFLEEVNVELERWTTSATHTERWLTDVAEAIDAASKLPTEDQQVRVENALAQRDAKRGDFEELLRMGKALVSKKDVTDTTHVRDKIKALETQWKELGGILEERQKLGKARAEQLSAYEKLRQQVLEWLNNMENRVSQLDPVAIEPDTIRKQAEEIKPLVKAYRDYANTIDKVNDLGNAYDSLLRGERPDSPSRRRSSAFSPSKRPSMSATPRRPSQDGRSPSPTKNFNNMQSPVSPSGSSGFSSRRSSQDGFHLEEMSPVQQQLTEINNRYSLLGTKLTDRQSEVEALVDEIKKHLDNLRALGQFLDKVQRQLPKDSVPQSRDEADKLARQIKAVVEELYEKQSLLDSTRNQVNDLLKRKPGAPGADMLRDELADVTSRWKGLHDRCKDRTKFMEDLKDLLDTHDHLATWLTAKDRMMTVLGPISSDSRMVQSQVQQVQVLREEFRTQQPQLKHLTELGDSVLSRLDPNSSDAQRVGTKVDNIVQRWTDLLGRLEERANSLGAAADTSKEFDAGLARLRDALQAISDELDDLPLDKEAEELLRKIENLERQLEGKRPLLADAEAAGEQLCRVLGDAASRAEIQGKLSQVNRQYQALQRKLDHRKAELEGSVRDGRQFGEACALTLGWLTDELGQLSERLLVSADRAVLQQQLEQHEPVYREVMQKEHEVIMLLNKGRDILSRSPQQRSGSDRSLQRDLEKIQQAWDKLRKETVDRNTRLQTCMEHCRKYYRVQDSFLPWLGEAESRLESLRPASFKKKDIERQLKELQSFRNEVWRHSGEYENTRALGDTFLSACDMDKEVVRNELASMKQRWDALNNDLMELTQSLEETARRLSDFSDNLRELQHSLTRCEDKLASHDALGGASKDPKLLDRIKSLREEAAALKPPLNSVRQQASDLVAQAAEHGADATPLQDEVEGLSERLDDLQARLDDRCSELQSAATAVTQFNDQVKGLTHDLGRLEEELDAMKPPARDIKTVRTQIDDTTKLLRKISKAAEDVAHAVEAGEELVDSGFAPDTQATREQVELLQRQLGRLEERARGREETLETTLQRLEGFYQVHQSVVRDIADTWEQVKRFKPVATEVEAIRIQQEEYRDFHHANIEALTVQVDECNKTGQGLIQSAAAGVNTSSLEKDLEKMNEKWNDLKERLNERERKLDVALLQSGKFQEALDGLAKWLTDTEEMVANQKPPSADYKVVKAQLQEQKFLRKMLLDRQNSMSSLFAMGSEVAASADPSERKQIERQLHELMGRFDALQTGAQERHAALEQAMAVAKQFQDKLLPLNEWLDKTEKRVKDMELVPTDEEKIEQRIREHEALNKDIMRKKPDFDELTEIASALMALVGEDEASLLADRLQEACDRYAALALESQRAGELLLESKAGLRHLVLSYQELQGWMDDMEARLGRYRVLAVHVDKLLEQMNDLADLTEEVANHQSAVDATVDSGLELMKHISNDEALQLKDKLDSLQRRFSDLTAKGSDLLRQAQVALPLVQNFHESHARLVDWMLAAEGTLQSLDSSAGGLGSGGSSSVFGHGQEEEIRRLEADIAEYRPVLDTINVVGPQLCQLSPGEGAATIEGLVTRDNRRFDAICEQIQRKAERIQLSKQRSMEVISDIDELLDWFREVESQIREAEPPSADPDVIRVQLKEHKALNDDISSQKGRVRDVLSTAKKVLRESSQSDDTSAIREKAEDLREAMDTVSALSSDRLSCLEQALPLAEHFHETHAGLSAWMDDMEQQAAMLALPALRPDLIAQQQDRNELFMQSINEHKPLVDKLNKTGEALVRLCSPDEGAKVQDIVDADNARYNALRSELRARQQELEKALQESSQFSDKLEGMLRALAQAADAVQGAEPVSAHPPKIRDQIDENAALAEDLEKRESAFEAVKRAAEDVIGKAGNKQDSAVRDIKQKLERLNSLWNEVQKATSVRGRTLDSTLAVAERFWKELQAIMQTLKDLQDTLNSQEPPAVEPSAIRQQKEALKEIKHEIDQTKPEVEQVRVTGQNLMKMCGEPDKPEVKKHMEDLDSAWDNITSLYARREENLIDAMEKAMEFHETLQNLLAFLDNAERKFAKMGALGADTDGVKRQIEQLKDFKAEVDPQMVKVEALNRQAQELTERTSADQAAAIKEPLSAVNRRWDDLLHAMVERQRQLEQALLKLGEFQTALAQLMVWIESTNKTLDELKPVAGDPQVLEVELAKLKVIVNDIQAHQRSVDTLNDAGRQIIESEKGSANASATQEKLNTLNSRWRDLLQRTADRQRELEDALRDAQAFHAEVQDLLAWLSDVDGVIAASKPVGGLPETASEQLERFMEVYNELEENRPKVETVLQQGNEYLKKSTAGAAKHLQNQLKTLKQRWDSVTARANDKKIKLEIALKEANEFHQALQEFVDWLTSAEKTLNGVKPVSRVMDTILGQIEEHKAFQKEVGTHRETMLALDKKGTHLKYFSQKQDVILIKNLLISVQHRWERVVSKSAERTRALDLGYKEAKDLHDNWSQLMTWLDEAETSLDELAAATGNDPEKIKTQLSKHKEFQRALAAKQPSYDATMRLAKAVKDKAPKMDEPRLKDMMSELKNKWNSVCAKSVDRQRKLEEALLFSGQFKDAVQALLEWLQKVETTLGEEGPVHGDLDTVTALMEKHKSFKEDLQNREAQLKSVTKTGAELQTKASPADAETIRKQLDQLSTLWSKVSRLSERRSSRLEEALKEAEKLHKSVHMLLEWLSDAEMKLRFAGQMPEDELECRTQMEEHARFLRELSQKEYEKDETIELAQCILEKAHPDAVSVIKHWITIIQSRWDEVSSWAKQRESKLKEHVQSLKDMEDILEELLAWLGGLERTLMDLEAEELPEEPELIEGLIKDHTEFMENTSKRQGDVDQVCKPRQIQVPNPTKQTNSLARKGSKPKAGFGLRHGSRESTPGPQTRKDSRASPGREKTPADDLPHYGPRFPPRGSKSDPQFRNPRVKLLWDRWRNVWMLSWERQRRLHDRLKYLIDLEKVRNFSWDDWRKRFLKFMNNKKSRLTDLFRKIDKNGDSYIPREDFIDGIMKTKFDTSRLEMNAVADMFDHNSEGVIDWHEFIAALRPDWQEKQPNTEAEKIHDEVKRLVMMCTCRQKFRVYQVGEGKYRFGDSQKLRLVRILRSTVMVRVGGGWVALDEFLVKNDPCRAEYFMSQLMPIFESLRQQEEIPCSYPLAMGSNVPVYHWVRERSSRSVPMASKSGGRSSFSVGTPDSLSDNEGGLRPLRKASAPVGRSSLTPGSQPGSRPGSRTGSRPASRHGSNLSLDSTDDCCTPSRIPTRRVTAPSSGYGRATSSSARKLTVPVNGTAPSSRPRTPTGSSTPTGRPGAMQRATSASSIPSLSSQGIRSRTPSASNIPVLVNNSRARTPSGSSTSGTATPAQTPTSKLLRRSSGASDTAQGTARKGSKTTTPAPAPFRL